MSIDTVETANELAKSLGALNERKKMIGVMVDVGIDNSVILEVLRRLEE